MVRIKVGQFRISTKDKKHPDLDLQKMNPKHLIEIVSPFYLLILTLHITTSYLIKMKFKSSIAVTLLIISIRLASAQQSLQISNIQWPLLNYTMCTQSDVYVNIIRSCYNSTYTGATVVVSGFNITVDVNYTVVAPCNPILDFPGYQISLGLLPAGTYAVTVNANMNSVLQSTMGSSLTVNVGNCCQSIADAGPNTHICDTTGFQLNGNAPPSFSTANWTVVSGSGIISNGTLHNATVSNLSYGLNRFAWSMSDSTCATSDTVNVRNFETPSTAVTEADKLSCYDSVTINANVPTVGIGTWKSYTAGVSIFQKNDPKTILTNLNSSNLLTWTITNGICPSSVDTLKIEYNEVTVAPVITANNLTLSSNTAPSYQWYKDGNPIANETSQTYQVSANGVYSVYSVFPGCTNGLFSNEITFGSVGVSEEESSALRIYPNPASEILYLEKESGLNGEITIYNPEGRQVYKSSVINETRIKIDLSSYLMPGVYSVSYRESSGKEIRKAVVCIGD